MSFKNLNNFIQCPSILPLNKDIRKDNFDSSSEEDISSSKKFEDNFNINYETEWKTSLIENQNNDNKNKTSFNANKITRFDFFIKSNVQLEKKENIKKKFKSPKNEINKINNKKVKETKKRGRKRKREENSEIDMCDENNKNSHNKFSDDNLRKKVRNIILKYAMEFINKKIKEKYKDNIGLGKFKKELKILEQGKKVKSTVSFDKSFLKFSLKEIFSGDISSRSNNFPKDYNKTLIDSLINDKDEERKHYFIKLFNITFIDCLKYFIEDDKSYEIDELNGFIRISSIKEDLIKEHGEEYANILIYYLENFEEIINNKKERKPRKKYMDYLMENKSNNS